MILRKSLPILLACLLLAGCAALSPALPEPSSSAPEGALPGDASSPSRPTEEEPSPERVVLLGRALTSCGLGVEIPPELAADPNRPELAPDQVCFFANLSPVDIDSGGVFGASAADGEPFLCGGASAISLMVYDQFVSPSFKEQLEAEEQELQIETDGQTQTVADRRSRQFMEHDGHFYRLNQNYMQGLLVAVFQAFPLEELEQPGAVIRLGDGTHAPEELAHLAVYENETHRVYAYTRIGPRDLRAECEAIVRDRAESPLYRDDRFYDDPDYDYSWVLPAADTLAEHPGALIVETLS